ncbi:hypothetical protein Droror1_Dr00004239 [Drosera rotundifolia]
MASFPIIFTSVAASPPVRLYAATASKSSDEGEKKSLLDWILGGLQKPDQLFETDPILKKVEEKGNTNSGGGSSGGKGNSVDVPKNGKKNGGGGFGGLFEKK